MTKSGNAENDCEKKRLSMVFASMQEGAKLAFRATSTYTIYLCKQTSEREPDKIL